MTDIDQWLTAGPWPTDGALGSLLEERGHRLSDLLWSTSALIEHPEAIAQVHRDYVAAGATPDWSVKPEVKISSLLTHLQIIKPS